MARLLADENIAGPLIEGLRAAGHEVLSVADVRLLGASDQTILAAAHADDRILLTADKDFGLILESGPLAGTGRVLLLRYTLLDWPRMAADVVAVLAVVIKDYATDPRLLVVVSEAGYRVRHAAP